MTTYLVTGGAGFIGSNFVKHLLESYPAGELRIVVVDALTYAGNLATLRDELARPDFEFVKADIGNQALMQELIDSRDVDYVVNFAAESHVDRSISEPRLFLTTNVLGTQSLLEAARTAWLTGKGPDGKPQYKPGKKFLQISTDEVYGSLPRDYAEPQPLELEERVRAIVGQGRERIITYGRDSFTEEHRISPRSPYSAAKASADMIAMAYHHTYGLPVCVTRCSNNYGPYHFPEKLIPLIICNVLAGRKIPVYGRGENVRDWLYVTDHARAIDLVLRRGRAGQVYNIGGFNEESNINIVRTVIATLRELLTANEAYRSALRIPLEQVSEELITYVTDRPGHDMRYAINPTKIATELGWYPATPFTEGIRLTVKWYLENQDWVANVLSGDYMNYYHEMYDNR